MFFNDELEFLEWLKFKTEKLPKAPTTHRAEIEKINFPCDYWSMYDYGEIIKIVYFKKGKKKKAFKKENIPLEHTEDERFSQSISRSKARIFELAMCNEFTHFCTFTQDEKLRDRFNLAEFRTDFAQFVRNQNRGRENKIKYLLIPEKHKNGAWHMHGFLMGLTDTDLRLFNEKEHLPYRILEQIKGGKNIYDWAKYRRKFGYFTATEIKNKTACSKYITKYVTKDLQSEVRAQGEHLFFASQGLKGREIIVKNSFEPCPFVGGFDFENDYIKIKEVSANTDIIK